MSSFAAQTKEANVADIHRVVQCDGERYLCFTRLATSWFVSVTDGVTLWRVDLDEEEVDALRDLAGVTLLKLISQDSGIFPVIRKFQISNINMMTEVLAIASMTSSKTISSNMLFCRVHHGLVEIILKDNLSWTSV